MVCLKHRSSEAVRLHIEEVEPRLVPSGGDWHALVQAGKALDQTYRRHEQFNVVADPYCNGTGTDPGPCAAWPDVVRLRAELYDLGEILGQTQAQARDDYAEALDHLQALKDQHAPFAQVHQAQLQVNYWHGFYSWAEADWQDVVRGTAATDDNHLVAFADGLYEHNGVERHAHFLDLAKNVKKTAHFHLENHYGADHIIADEQWESEIGGTLDENELFMYYFLSEVH